MMLMAYVRVVVPNGQVVRNAIHNLVILAKLEVFLNIKR